jgi:hypothetical protein
MPAFHNNITITQAQAAANTAAAVSDGAVLAARVHNPGGFAVILQATTANTAPTSRAGGVTLAAGATLATDLTLAQLFPGLGTNAVFLWAFSDMPTTLSVSHA